jgi:hypothetical protein
MKRQIIINIIECYEFQLLSAEIKKDKVQINWLRDQINEAKKELSNIIYN